MIAYATPQEFRARARRSIPDGTTDEELRYLLEDASVFLRATYTRIPENPGDSLLAVLRVITIAIVKRAILADKNAELNDGAESVTDTAGPFTTTQSFRNSEGNFYISSQEQKMLENELARTEGDRKFRCITAEGW